MSHLLARQPGNIEAMVLFKVGVSCYAAVLSDAKLKGFSNMSMSAKLSLMSLSRVIASVGIAAVMEPGVQPSYNPSAAGFFDHWTLATWIVTLSFTSKSLITLYLLKSLDGIQKNVGEAGTSKMYKHRTPLDCRRLSSQKIPDESRWYLHKSVL